MISDSPIAVLDSGAGGLSVVRALRALLPREHIWYFADTAHWPYGPKSPELIMRLALRIVGKIQELSSCKLLIIACHTISTWCSKQIADLLNIPVISMVEPTVNGLRDLVLRDSIIKQIGIISTKATQISGVYRKAWPFVDPLGRVALCEASMGILVSLVEDADLDLREIAALIERVLPMDIKQSDALLIGCTHFSALTSALRSILGQRCQLLDAAFLVAREAANTLGERRELNHAVSHGSIKAYVTDNPERFELIARRFMDEKLMIEWLKNYV